MLNNILSNSIGKENIELLLSVRNSINNLKKDDNGSLFALVAELDTDANNTIDSGESVLVKILNLGENKLASIAKHLGFAYTPSEVRDVSNETENINILNEDIAQITKKILKNIFRKFM